MLKKFLSVVIAACFSVAMMVPPCQAATTPTGKVRAMLDKVMSIQTDPKLQGPTFREQRRVAIRKVIAANFQFGVMARQTLGSYWQKLDRRQRSEFASIFQDLFSDSYTRLVLDFLKREKIQYNEQKALAAGALVKTTIYRTGEAIPVDYLLSQVRKDWLVKDVTIDGVSIVQNYRQSFGKVIRKESFKSLLKKMRLQQRVEEKD